MKKKLFLVTGGGGFLGAALVRRILAEGHRVRVLDNFSRRGAPRLEGLNGSIELVRGDIRNAATVSRAVKGVDSVCHLAFVNGTEFFYTKPDLVLDVGVRGMINVLDACQKHGVKDLVLASSSEVYQTPPRVPTDESVPLSVPDPLNPRYSYGGGKIISELLTINFGRKHFKRAVIFRPHNVYGPNMGYEHVVPQLAMRMKKLARPGKVVDFPIQGSGRETRAFVYVDDFTDGLWRVIAKGKHLGIYHIGTMEEVPIRRVVELVARAFGQKIRIQPGPAAKGGTPRRCPDISKIKKLGFRPKTSLEEGVRRTCEWYMNNGREK